MLNKFRRKLAKLIAPKPVKRVKKVKKTYSYDLQYAGLPNHNAINFVKDLQTDKSYKKNKLNKQATVVVVGEEFDN
jgi:hypothetical protein